MNYSDFSLGFWIEATEQAVPAAPTITYRGLDRVTAIPFPAAEIDETGIENVEQVVSSLRAELADASETGELNASLELAKVFRERFSEIGIPTEIVAARIIEVPNLDEADADLADRLKGELERRAWINEAVSSNLAGLQTELFGIDVVYPVPSFHSAIFQPELASVDDRFWTELNAFGLFSNDAAATAASIRVNNSSTSRRPFCPVEVRRVLVDDTD